MRGFASLLVATALGGVLWAGLSYRASLAQVESRGSAQTYERSTGGAQATSEEPARVLVAEQREQLNLRLHSMLVDGRGTRLSDEGTVRLKRHVGQTSRRKTEAGSTHDNIRRANYSPPRLDLSSQPNIPDNDLDCLTQAIYYEARNESEAGQAAVAEVVMNRVRHPSYPKRICEVVYQRNSRTCQFTFTCDGSIGRSSVRAVAWSRAQRIAREVLEGRSFGQLPSNSVNYHANYVRPSWGQRLAKVRQIGAHIFYGAPLTGGSPPGSIESSRSADGLFVRNEATEKAYESLIG